MARVAAGVSVGKAQSAVGDILVRVLEWVNMAAIVAEAGAMIEAVGKTNSVDFVVGVIQMFDLVVAVVRVMFAVEIEAEVKIVVGKALLDTDRLSSAVTDLERVKAQVNYQ